MVPRPRQIYCVAGAIGVDAFPSTADCRHAARRSCAQNVYMLRDHGTQRCSSTLWSVVARGHHDHDPRHREAFRTAQTLQNSESRPSSLVSLCLSGARIITTSRLLSFSVPRSVRLTVKLDSCSGREILPRRIFSASVPKLRLRGAVC